MLFFAGSWKVGVVREVGIASQERARYAAPTERKFRISPVEHPDWSDWVDWGYVASATRDASWTRFFVGEWALGEVMAVNSRVEGADILTQYSFHSATEALRILADGTFEWKQPRQAVVRGRWVASPDGPGIVLQRGARGKTWTFRNETNATEENIRGIESARLTTPGVMSIKAKRPMAARSIPLHGPVQGERHSSLRRGVGTWYVISEKRPQSQPPVKPALRRPAATNGDPRISSHTSPDL